MHIVATVIRIRIHNDKDIKSYKRNPILTMEQRVPMLEGCKYIDKIMSLKEILIPYRGNTVIHHYDEAEKAEMKKRLNI